jgi:hypothetical protein
LKVGSAAITGPTRADGDRLLTLQTRCMRWRQR